MHHFGVLLPLLCALARRSAAAALQPIQGSFAASNAAQIDVLSRRDDAPDPMPTQTSAAIGPPIDEIELTNGRYYYRFTAEVTQFCIDNGISSLISVKQGPIEREKTIQFNGDVVTQTNPNGESVAGQLLPNINMQYLSGNDIVTFNYVTPDKDQKLCMWQDFEFGEAKRALAGKECGYCTLIKGWSQDELDCGHAPGETRERFTLCRVEMPESLVVGSSKYEDRGSPQS